MAVKGDTILLCPLQICAVQVMQLLVQHSQQECTVCLLT